MNLDSKSCLNKWKLPSDWKSQMKWIWFYKTTLFIILAATHCIRFQILRMTITTAGFLITLTLAPPGVNTSHHSKARSRRYVLEASHRSPPRFAFPEHRIGFKIKGKEIRTWRYSKWLSICLFLNIALILNCCLAPKWRCYNCFSRVVFSVCWFSGVVGLLVVSPFELSVSCNAG